MQKRLLVLTIFLASMIGCVGPTDPPVSPPVTGPSRSVSGHFMTNYMTRGRDIYTETYNEYASLATFFEEDADLFERLVSTNLNLPNTAVSQISSSQFFTKEIYNTFPSNSLEIELPNGSLVPIKASYYINGQLDPAAISSDLGITVSKNDILVKVADAALNSVTTWITDSLGNLVYDSLNHTVKSTAKVASSSIASKIAGAFGEGLDVLPGLQLAGIGLNLIMSLKMSAQLDQIQSQLDQMNKLMQSMNAKLDQIIAGLQDVKGMLFTIQNQISNMQMAALAASRNNINGSIDSLALQVTQQTRINVANEINTKYESLILNYINQVTSVYKTYNNDPPSIPSTLVYRMGYTFTENINYDYISGGSSGTVFIGNGTSTKTKNLSLVDYTVTNPAKVDPMSLLDLDFLARSMLFRFKLNEILVRGDDLRQMNANVANLYRGYLSTMRTTAISHFNTFKTNSTGLRAQIVEGLRDILQLHTSKTTYTWTWPLPTPPTSWTATTLSGTETWGTPTAHPKVSITDSGMGTASVYPQFMTASLYSGLPSPLPGTYNGYSLIVSSGPWSKVYFYTGYGPPHATPQAPVTTNGAYITSVSQSGASSAGLFAIGADGQPTASLDASTTFNVSDLLSGGETFIQSYADKIVLLYKLKTKDYYAFSAALASLDILLKMYL